MISRTDSIAGLARLGADAVRQLRPGFSPRWMVTLGSGLGSAATPEDVLFDVPFHALPGLDDPSVPGHAGRVRGARWRGEDALLFLGRLHRYEGHDCDRVGLPARIAKALGAEGCLLANMSGAIRPSLEPGTLMVVDDHILPPTIGARSLERSGRRSPYCPELRESLLAASAKVGVALARGTYLAVTGPNYETPAEIRAFGRWGADVVGMSTAIEAQTAAGLGLACASISCVANWAAGIADAPIRHDEVLRAASACADRLGRVLAAFFDHDRPRRDGRARR